MSNSGTPVVHLEAVEGFRMNNHSDLKEHVRMKRVKRKLVQQHMLMDADGLVHLVDPFKALTNLPGHTPDDLIRLLVTDTSFIIEELPVSGILAVFSGCRMFFRKTPTGQIRIQYVTGLINPATNNPVTRKELFCEFLSGLVSWIFMQTRFSVVTETRTMLATIVHPKSRMFVDPCRIVIPGFTDDNAAMNLLYLWLMTSVVATRMGITDERLVCAVAVKRLAASPTSSLSQSYICHDRTIIISRQEYLDLLARGIRKDMIGGLMFRYLEDGFQRHFITNKGVRL